VVSAIATKREGIVRRMWEDLPKKTRRKFGFPPDGDTMHVLSHLGSSRQQTGLTTPPKRRPVALTDVSVGGTAVTAPFSPFLVAGGVAHAATN
jgi:hypothetical protein